MIECHAIGEWARQDVSGRKSGCRIRQPGGAAGAPFARVILVSGALQPFSLLPDA